VTVCKNEWKYVANIAWELERNLPQVACYPAEINQVVLNLIVNSAHAIEEKMGITGDRTKGTITLRTRAIEDGLRIEIMDSGIGIKQEIKERIFEPFFTTKGVGKGTGQGLAMAYACIQQKHKGKISFESKEGEGTKFIIELPR
jgi:signal transduction histidine kinase